eukprot:g36486.t1
MWTVLTCWGYPGIAPSGQQRPGVALKSGATAGFLSPGPESSGRAWARRDAAASGTVRLQQELVPVSLGRGLAGAAKLTSQTQHIDTPSRDVTEGSLWPLVDANLLKPFQTKLLSFDLVPFDE